MLKLADQKKDIPVKIEKKVIKKDGEFSDRPMTKREKDEYIRENEFRLRKEGKLPAKEKSPKLTSTKTEDKYDNVEKTEKVVEKPKIKSEPGPSFHSAVLKSMPPPDKRKEDSEKSALERQRKELEAKMKDLDRQREELDKKTKIEADNRRKRLEYERKMEEIKRRQFAETQERRKIEQEKKKLNSMQEEYEKMQKKMKEMEARLAAGKSKEPRDVHSVESRPFPGEKKRRDKDRGRDRDRGYQRRLESDSEEYDSELDDFIDDSDAKFDYSAEIRSIFK